MSMMIPATSSIPTSNDVNDSNAGRREAPGTLEALCAVAPTRTIATRGELFLEGDRRRSFFQVVSGAILQSKLHGDGSRQNLYLALPLDFLALPVGENYSCDARALGDTVVRCIPATAVRFAHLQGPAFMHTVCRHLSAEVSRLQSHLLILGRPGATQRVAALVLDLLERQPCPASDRLPYTIPLSRSDMGELLCISFESVSRSMSRLKRAGALGMSDPRTIVQVRLDQLSRIAGREASSEAR